MPVLLLPHSYRNIYVSGFLPEFMVSYMEADGNGKSVDLIENDGGFLRIL